MSTPTAPMGPSILDASTYQGEILRRLRLSKYIPHFPHPKQAYALLLPHMEVFYGGAGGGGKSDWLLMGALQYVDVSDYAAILFRRTFSELSKPEGLMQRAHEWLYDTDAHWDAKRATYIFPSGAELVFSHMESENDKMQHRSAAYQYCTATGTPILLANGAYCPVERLRPGMLVQTLQGAKPITYCAPPRLAQCYELLACGTATVVSASHRILTPDGWVSPLAELSKQCYAGEARSVAYRALSSEYRMPDTPQWRHRQPALRAGQLKGGEGAPQGSAAWSRGRRNGCAAFDGGPQGEMRPRLWCVPAVLYAPALQLDRPYNESAYPQHGERHGLHGTEAVLDSRSDYHAAHDFRDGQSLWASTRAQGSIRQPIGVALRSLPRLQEGGHGHTQGYSLPAAGEYFHPYTNILQRSHVPLVHADIEMRPAGVQVVHDLTVAEASHYISYGGLIASNCGFDELTTFTESQYRFLFSRLRRKAGSLVPVRMRSASNPGGPGHQFVKRRFVTPGADREDRAFVPAKIADNPTLDRADYERSLAQLDPVTRAQIEDGNWDILAEGNMFKRHWFKIVHDWPRDGRAVRFWDFAATEARAGTDPDYTVGLKMVEKGGQFWIVDIKRDRLSPLGVEALLAQTAHTDGRNVAVWLEQEPGSSGKTVAEDYQRRVLKGYTVHINKPSTNKEERAKPVSSAAEANNVFLVDGPWVDDFLDEVAPFPGGEHDDQVDTLSGAHTALAGQGTLSISRL